LNDNKQKEYEKRKQKEYEDMCSKMNKSKQIQEKEAKLQLIVNQKTQFLTDVLEIAKHKSKKVNESDWMTKVNQE